MDRRRILTLAAALLIVLSATGRSLAGFQVYVANVHIPGGTGGDTIGSFSSTGTHLGAFPNPNPWGVAVSPSGDVYATSGDKINVFSPSGTPLMSFGNSAGITPFGLAFDTADNLLVGGSGLIERFSPTGADLGQFAPSFPAGWLAVGPTGDVYASGGAAIDWFSPSGQKLGSFSGGYSVSGLASDSAGDLYAVIANSGIEKFSPTLTDLGPVVSPGTLGEGQGLALTPDGNLLVADFNISSQGGIIREFSLTGADLGTFATGPGEPIGIAVGLSAVPEPSSLLLSSMAALGVMGFLRRRRMTRASLRRHPNIECLEAKALLTAGALDPTFVAGAGFVTTDLGTTQDSAHAVAVEPWDGKIVVAENHRAGSYFKTNLDFTLVRYNTDGSLDTTFGTGGVVTTDFNGGLDAVNTIVFTPDHKIVAVGTAYITNGKAPGAQIGVARYNADGTLDSTFGSGGKVTVAASSSLKTSVYGGSIPDAAVLDPAGRLVIAGSYSGPKGSGFPPFYYANALVRLNVNGTLDSTFGNKGIVLGSIGQTTYDGWATLRLQPVGSSYKIDVVGSDQGKQALVQLNYNGSRDGTFGSNGEVFLAGSSGWSAWEPDGGFVGIANHNDSSSLTVTRYDASGNVVFDHAVDYGALLPPGTYPGGLEIKAVAIDPSGRIVLGGGVGDSIYGWNSALMRLDASGNLDTTFGSGGLVVNHFGPYDDEITCLAFQADGSIIAAGYIDDGDGSFDANGNVNEQKDVLVARYQSD